MKCFSRRQIRCLLLVFVISTLGLTCIFQLSLSYDQKEGDEFRLLIGARWRSEVEKSIRELENIVTDSAKRFETYSTALNHRKYKHDFRYIIDNSDFCNGEELVFFGVMSAPGNEKRRQGIRTTWASELSKNSSIRVLFFIGLPSDQQTQKMLYDENEKYSDIIQEEFVDSYKNLTLKSIMFMKWIALHCQKIPPLVVKCDDDVFVHLPLLLNISMVHIVQPKTMFGWLLVNTTRMLDPKNKFYVPDQEYKDKIYPPYLAGPLYAMTGDCVPEIYNCTLGLPRVSMEDVYITGICAHHANLSLKHEVLMNTEPIYPWPSCQLLTNAVRHEAAPNDMKRMWIHFQEPCPHNMLQWAKYLFATTVELFLNLNLTVF